MRTDAGKPTAMRVILDLGAPAEGSAPIGGHPCQSLRRPLTHVGVLLDARGPAVQWAAVRRLLPWLAAAAGHRRGAAR